MPLRIKIDGNLCEITRAVIGLDIYLDGSRLKVSVFLA